LTPRKAVPIGVPCHIRERIVDICKEINQLNAIENRVLINSLLKAALVWPTMVGMGFGFGLLSVVLRKRTGGDSKLVIQSESPRAHFA
jgi:hypothetical protein